MCLTYKCESHFHDDLNPALLLHQHRTLGTLIALPICHLTHMTDFLSLSLCIKLCEWGKHNMCAIRNELVVEQTWAYWLVAMDKCMPERTVGCLKKRVLETNYYSIGTHYRWFGGGFKEAGLCCGSDAVSKLRQFYDWVSWWILSRRQK